MTNCLGVAFGMLLLGAFGGILLAAAFEANKEVVEINQGIAKLDGGLYFIGERVEAP